jgi:hypothetical protein
MIKRVWTANSDPFEADEKVVIYDFGEYVGWYWPQRDEWSCWRLSFNGVDGDSVCETLEMCEEGWVPMVSYSEEEYPARRLRESQGVFVIRGGAHDGARTLAMAPHGVNHWKAPRGSELTGAGKFPRRSL